MKKITLLMPLLLVLLQPSSVPAAKKLVHLHYGIGHAPMTLDPANIMDVESAAIALQAFEGLVRFAKSSTAIEPALATEWTVSEDKLKWTFKLRKGVKFHDGTPLNAGAVVSSFQRQSDLAHPGHFGPFIYWKNTYNIIHSVEVQGEDTVVITLVRPHSPFLSDMAMFPVAMVSPEAVKKWKSEFWRHPVGTGPFKFRSWMVASKEEARAGVEETIVLDANPDYWGGKPQIDRVTFKAIPRPADRQAALLNGSIDLIDQVDLGFVKEVKRHLELNVKMSVGTNVAYLAMNITKQPFDKQLVRQAVNQAIDKKYIVDNLYQGLAAVAKNPIPPTLWGYNDAVTDYEYTPSKARDLLATAGFPNGFQATLLVMDAPRPYLPEPKLVAERIAAELTAIGINTFVVVKPWKDYLQLLRNGEHEMALIGWVGDNGDPDNFLYTMFDKENAVRGTGNNFAFYTNEEVHKLLVQARQEADKSERDMLYKKAQQIIHNDAPWVPIAHSMQVVAAREGVLNLVVHPTSVIYLSGVIFEEPRKPALPQKP